jgi:hypothetical protein
VQIEKVFHSRFGISTLTVKIYGYTIAPMYNQTSQPSPSAQAQSSDDDEKHFVEFRRKVRGAEVLSAAMESLLRSAKFSGRICVVVQNGRVLKSGYEEGFFRHRNSL